MDIQTAEDVTPECLTEAEQIFCDWFDNGDEPIDWERFWDRLETVGYTVTDMDSPACRKIQRHVRKFRSES